MAAHCGAAQFGPWHISPTTSRAAKPIARSSAIACQHAEQMLSQFIAAAKAQPQTVHALFITAV
jgi:hypothetical protein